jgi:hypothetical protein
MVENNMLYNSLNRKAISIKSTVKQNKFLSKLYENISCILL